MKQIKNIVAMAASAIIWACTPDVEPLSFTAPVVEAEGARTRSVSIGEPETFTVRIVEGDGLTMSWYVDGLLEASGPSLTYSWDVAGDYEVRFEASNGSGKDGKTYNVNVSDKLEIFLSAESAYEIENEIECLEQSWLQVGAVVRKGSNVRHEWKVDGEVKGTEAYFGTFWLPAGLGTYQVSYKGNNSIGEFSKTFTVNVMEREFTVEFSESASTITHNPKNGDLTVSANVLYGGSGAIHSWILDGEVVSEGETMTYTLTEPGTHRLKYHGVNSKGESVDREWNVIVLKRDEVFLEDYEDGKGNGVFVQQNGGKLKVIANPYKSEANDSDYVLEVTGDTGSGYFGFVYGALTAMGIDWSGYKGIKVEMYIPNTKFYPVMDFNGKKIKANADTPYKYNEWVSLDYDLNFTTSTPQFQPRPFVNETGGGNAGKNSVVYYDNIYLYK